MANNGAAAEARIPMGEWEAGRSRTTSSDGLVHHHHQQPPQQSPTAGSNQSSSSHHQNPIPSTSSSPRISQIAPTQGAASAAAATSQKPAVVDGGLSGKLWKLLFFAHLLLFAALTNYLAARGFRARNCRRFHPSHWYVPLLASAAAAALMSLTWLFVTLGHPAGAIRTSLWFGPVLTCALGILLSNTASAVGLAFAVIAVVSAAIMSVYACWVTPRRPHARDILDTSLEATRSAIGIRKFSKFMVIALTVGTAYSALWILAAGGVAADSPRLAALYVVLLLLSLAWTMQVVRNVLHVAISGFAYMHLTRRVYIDPSEAFRNACTLSMGSVCLGSAVVPVVGAFRWTARGMGLVAGDADEFLFSCVDCYAGLARRLVAYGNRWGFVRVGVYAEGFVAASEKTWESFARQGMGEVIDSDLTSSFCFLCGVSGGAASALAVGIWVLASADKSYVAGVSLYAFCITYFMVRIAMAWPQACVSACHVAYAEDPQGQQFQSPLAHRMRELQRSRV